MPSRPQQSKANAKEMGATTKKLMSVLPILLAAAAPIGTIIYQLNENIRSNFRNLEKMQIKDYRQHRDILRHRVRFLGDAAATMEAVLEIDPGRLGPNGSLIVRKKREQHEEAKELLENYVEENKHYGSSD